MWNLPPPPRFQGLRDDLALTQYFRNLPHWRQDGATYFATFRLGDSLPAVKLHELAGVRAEWEERHPPPQPIEAWEELTRIQWERTEKWLDVGEGECLLRQPHLSQHLVDSLDRFHGTSEPARYELGAYVVMPNHVHAIVRPLKPSEWPLESLIGSWKTHSSRKIHQALDRQGKLWQHETFDRIIRDEEHLWRTLQYVGRNPRNANLQDGEFKRWVSPEWESLGWTFEDRQAKP